MATKVISALAKLQRQKVIDLAAWRAGKAQAEAVQESLISEPELAKLDPAHAVYVYAQNQLSVMIEQLITLPQLAKLSDVYTSAEEEYMPSGPPMSPLTRSYFTSWGTFDLTAGVKRETLASIAIAVSRYLGTEPALIELFETLSHSRMGVYYHQGLSGRYIEFTELVTEQPIKAICPSGYSGRHGDLWLARVLPPAPLPNASDYSVVFTTPYLLGELDDSGRCRRAQKADWLAYFTRTRAAMKNADPISAYQQLMKYGLSRHHWNEYIFLAYVNHTHDSVLLAGFPDIPQSLLHSRVGRARWSE